MMCDDGDRVRRTYEGIISVNHIPVTITIGSSAKGNFLFIDTFDKGMCVGEIGIGMSAAEIGAGMAILSGRGRQTEFGLEDTDTVGTGD